MKGLTVPAAHQRAPPLGTRPPTPARPSFDMDPPQEEHHQKRRRTTHQATALPGGRKPHHVRHSMAMEQASPTGKHPSRLIAGLGGPSPPKITPDCTPHGEQAASHGRHLQAREMPTFAVATCRLTGRRRPATARHHADKAPHREDPAPPSSTQRAHPLNARGGEARRNPPVRSKLAGSSRVHRSQQTGGRPELVRPSATARIHLPRLKASPDADSHHRGRTGAPRSSTASRRLRPRTLGAATSCRPTAARPSAIDVAATTEEEDEEKPGHQRPLADAEGRRRRGRMERGGAAAVAF
jgi:hypothetical protein